MCTCATSSSARNPAVSVSACVQCQSAAQRNRNIHIVCIPTALAVSWLSPPPDCKAWMRRRARAAGDTDDDTDDDGNAAVLATAAPGPMVVACPILLLLLVVVVLATASDARVVVV